MKIVYCIPALYNPSGMERVLTVKANYLAELGHEIIIVTSDQDGRAIHFPLHPSIRTYDVGANHEQNNGKGLLSKLLGYPAKYLRHKRRLTALLQELKADVVVSMFGEEAAFLPSIADGSHKVLEYHFSKLKRLQYDRKGLWRMVDEWRTREDERTVARYERFVVLTQEDADLWGTVSSNMQVIPNPLPFESDSPSPLSAKRILAAGRYCHQKDFASLIKIWANVAPKHPDWELAIYGDGPLRGELQALVDQLGIGSQTRLERPNSDMQSVYRNSSIYAMTSLYEGLPMVLIEAQTMGLPIVSYTCPCGPKDVVEHGVTGYLHPMGDAEGFAASLERLIQQEDLRQGMGASARRASQRYALGRIMPQWVSLFEGLTQASK